MKFELTSYYRNIPDGELLEDVKKVVKELGKDTITRDEYNQHGKFHSSTVTSRFSSWNNALQLAGLELNHSTVSDDDLLNDLKEVATQISKVSLTTREYEVAGGKYHITTFVRRFKNWNKALNLAGLKVANERNVETEALFENLEEVWLRLGRQPHYKDMAAPTSRFGGKMYVNRFGSWQKALIQFVTIVNSEVSEQGGVQVSDKEIDEIQLGKDDESRPAGDANMRHKTKRDINWRLRFLVLRRDNFKCVACGRSPATHPDVILHVDHIVAWDKGGETVFENLQALCSVCNIGKSNLDFSEDTELLT